MGKIYYKGGSFSSFIKKMYQKNTMYLIGSNIDIDIDID